MLGIAPLTRHLWDGYCLRMNADDFTRMGEKMSKAGDDIMGAGVALVLLAVVVLLVLVLL